MHELPRAAPSCTRRMATHSAAGGAADATQRRALRRKPAAPMQAVRRQPYHQVPQASPVPLLVQELRHSPSPARQGRRPKDARRAAAIMLLHGIRLPHSRCTCSSCNFHTPKPPVYAVLPTAVKCLPGHTSPDPYSCSNPGPLPKMSSGPRAVQTALNSSTILLPTPDQGAVQGAIS